METERLHELRVMNALGTIDEEDARELKRLEADERRELQSMTELSALVSAFASPLQSPSAHLKSRVMQAVQHKSAEADDRSKPNPLQFQMAAAESNRGWIPLRLKGAYIKMLSMDSATGKVVALGRLEAGTRYPAHHHHSSEDIYVLSGDLNIGMTPMKAGDFHHAESGSWHEENWSETGCMILAVSSLDNFRDQLQ